jgi:hypothetical protein
MIRLQLAQQPMIDKVAAACAHSLHASSLAPSVRSRTHHHSIVQRKGAVVV